MIYLSGHCSKELCQRFADRPDYGFLLTPAMGNKIPWSQIWAADTGCFRNPLAFDGRKYLSWLAARNPATCLFATAPDVPLNMRATLLHARYFMYQIRDLGYRVALVGQNGALSRLIPWDEFDCWFVGGDDDWKLGREAWALSGEAKARGKWIHFGRVNSRFRSQMTARRGADSVDGTYLAFGPNKNLPKLEKWHSWVNSQHSFCFRAE